MGNAVTNETQWILGAVAGGSVTVISAAVTIVVAAVRIGRAVGKFEVAAKTLDKLEDVAARVPVIESRLAMQENIMGRAVSDIKSLLQAEGHIRGRLDSINDASGVGEE